MTRTLSLVTVSLVLALATTMPARSDSRVRAVMYQENAVVRIDTNLRFITSVEFAAGLHGRRARRHGDRYRH